MASRKYVLNDIGGMTEKTPKIKLNFGTMRGTNFFLKKNIKNGKGAK